jgi:hypothetical protein
MESSTLRLERGCRRGEIERSWSSLFYVPALELGAVSSSALAGRYFGMLWVPFRFVSEIPD